ncbi:hypothetical protein VD659_05865 [Herbiconiux sp. 11R-BC]|uniref:hypothetical protein n=1 Tax=Herbiconiux sp. 11R-BC TaxID=3111637 RepID=UPI003BFBD086
MNDTWRDAQHNGYGEADFSVPFDDEVGLSEVLGERGMAVPPRAPDGRRSAEAPPAHTRIFRASALRLLPSVFGAFFDRREVVTRIEVSDVWVYATMGWHQTFLWHRGQVRFEVVPDKRTLTVDSFGESVELRCPHFSRALMAELHGVLADRGAAAPGGNGTGAHPQR